MMRWWRGGGGAGMVADSTQSDTQSVLDLERNPLRGYSAVLWYYPNALKAQHWRTCHAVHLKKQNERLKEHLQHLRAVFCLSDLDVRKHDHAKISHSAQKDSHFHISGNSRWLQSLQLLSLSFRAYSGCFAPPLLRHSNVVRSQHA